MDGLASAEAYRCSECGPSVSEQVPMSVDRRSEYVPSVFEQMGMVTDEPAPTHAEQLTVWGPSLLQDMDADRWENAGSDE